MNWTKQEIENSRMISQYVTKDIKYGDWIYDEDGESEYLFIMMYRLLPMVYQEGYDLSHRLLTCNWFPLWTWQDCREWLSQKGWVLRGHSEDKKHGIFIELFNYEKKADELYQINERGKTDTEAIQKCVIKVLEGDR